MLNAKEPKHWANSLLQDELLVAEIDQNGEKSTIHVMFQSVDNDAKEIYAIGVESNNEMVLPFGTFQKANQLIKFDFEKDTIAEMLNVPQERIDAIVEQIGYGALTLKNREELFAETANMVKNPQEAFFVAHILGTARHELETLFRARKIKSLLVGMKESGKSPLEAIKEFLKNDTDNGTI